MATSVEVAPRDVAQPGSLLYVCATGHQQWTVDPWVAGSAPLHANGAPKNPAVPTIIHPSILLLFQSTKSTDYNWFQDGYD